MEQYFRHLAVERGLSGASCRVHRNAIRFLYLKVLRWPAFDVPFVVPRRAQRIPELLTRDEVARILEACLNPKHRMLLEIGYGCGLRVSEVVRLRVRDCPQYQTRATRVWAERQQQALLPVRYFHQVFTLTHALNGWVQLPA